MSQLLENDPIGIDYVLQSILDVVHNRNVNNEQFNQLELCIFHSESENTIDSGYSIVLTGDQGCGKTTTLAWLVSKLQTIKSIRVAFHFSECPFANEVAAQSSIRGIIIEHLFAQLKAHFNELKVEYKLDEDKTKEEEPPNSFTDYMVFLSKKFPHVEFIMLVDCGGETLSPHWTRGIEKLCRNTHFIIAALSNSVLANVTTFYQLPKSNGIAVPQFHYSLP